MAPFVALVDTGTYTYNASHQFYSSLSGIGGTPQEIISPTVANGVFDGNDTTVAAVPAGASLEALVFYRKNSGANTTWRLVMFIDTGITGMPITPNGGDILITYHSSGIAAL